MNRIYIAGAYSANNVTKVLDNMREGMRLATEVFLAGFSPFCPWLDFHFQLMLRDNERLSVDDYYRYSLAWLEVSDAMLVGSWPGCEDSHGTKMEIKKAYELMIPIFDSINDLKAYQHLINNTESKKMLTTRNDRSKMEAAPGFEPGSFPITH